MHDPFRITVMDKNINELNDLDLAVERAVFVTRELLSLYMCWVMCCFGLSTASRHWVRC